MNKLDMYVPLRGSMFEFFAKILFVFGVVELEMLVENSDKCD